MECAPYTSKETPMIMYLNVHSSLERLRTQADLAFSAAAAADYHANARRAAGPVADIEPVPTPKGGPVTMIVGPADVGKSTLSRILLNYAVRMGRRPIFVDLDVGQGSISVPGTIGSLLVERPASIEEGFSQSAPLVYHYGHKTPGHNPPLYNKLVSRMADVVRERLDANKKAGASGVVINTCGWIRGEGYNQAKHIAQAFEVDVIIVLDQERLYNDLVRDMPDFVNVVWLPKSGGVVERNYEQRIGARDQRVKQYFYGHANNLFPHSYEVKFSELKDKIYKIGAPTLPDSCMPLGMKSDENQTKLVAVQPTNTRELLNRLLAVSFATSDKDLMMSNVAGFVCVTDINVKEEKITILAPQPRPIPNSLLLVSEIQFVDGQ